MEANFFVARATAEDVGTVAALFNSYRMSYRQESDIEGAKNFIEARLVANESVIFIARDENNDGIGFVQLYPSFSSVSMKNIWILNDLFVEEAARKQGVAKELMNQARELALETGARYIVLETGMDNTRAQSLYESLGYEKEDSYFTYQLRVGH